MRALALALLLLTACEDRGDPPAPQPPGTQPATEWEQGPRCINDSGSCGVPLHPTRTAEGVVIDVPHNPDAFNRIAAPHINYVDRQTEPLTGKTLIRIVYRVETPAGVNIRATKPRGEVWDGKLTLYFAREGNNFTGGAIQNWYRWYASSSTTRLHPGTYEIVARFDEAWTAVSYGANHCTTDGNDPDCRGPQHFQAALARADRVGFVLGGGDGLGHGVHADGPGARIVVQKFSVE